MKSQPSQLSSNQPPPGPDLRPRALWFFSISVTIVFLLLGVRLFYIQILAHDQHLSRARSGTGRTDSIPAYPGDLRTSDGVIVARSETAFSLGLDLRPLSEEQIPSVVAAASDALGYSYGRRRERVGDVHRRKAKRQIYANLARRVDGEGRDKVRESLSGQLEPRILKKALVVDRMTRRNYPKGEFLCHVIGVASHDGTGQEGLELSLSPWLGPRSGRRRVITDAREQFRIYSPETVEVAPVNGYDVYLTINSKAQGILEEELQRGISKHKAEAGLGVLMNCKTGSILAMASWPVFNPNDFHRYPPEVLAERRKNRVIENAYVIGSVIKPFIAASAVEAGVVRWDDKIWGGGRFHRIGGRRLEDVSNHGPISVEQAVVYSSNIGMGEIGMKLGRDRLIAALARFGFCRQTGIRLPGEAKGRHTPADKWNDIYSTTSVSMGYEVMITPIQLVTAFASLVNGGYLVKPRLVDKYVRAGEVIRNPPQLVGHTVTEEASGRMRSILHKIVEEGTGRYLKMKEFKFGGKTGTADMNPLNTKEDYLASFEAFAPLDDPEVVILVMIEKPRSGKIYGGSVAGPVVARVLRRYFSIPAKPEFERLKFKGW